MKPFNALLVALAALLGQVAANGASLGYEVVQFYYVYKMEYMSSIPAAEKRLGLTCSKALKRLCLFDEFALSVLADGPLKTYFQNTWATRTHTDTPDDTAASAISNNANNDDELVTSELSSTFPKDGEHVPYTAIVEDMTSVAQKAADAGGVDKADVDSAASYAEKARKVRADDAFPFVRNVINNVLGTVARKYFVNDPRGMTFNWRATFDNINNAATAGAINANQAKTYKKAISDASRGILTGTSVRNISHWAAVKSFSTFISKIAAISANLGSNTAAAPAGGGASCASEFSGGPGAASKRRRQLMEQAIASARQVVQLSPLPGFADGMMAFDGVAVN